jgi:hypothetical protein
MQRFPAVYAICSDKDIPRLRGSTNLVYVGSTKCLGGAGDRTRLYAYNLRDIYGAGFTPDAFTLTIASTTDVRFPAQAVDKLPPLKGV